MNYKETLEEAKSARKSLVEMIEVIEEQIKKVKDKEWDGPLSKADRDKLSVLRANKSSTMLAVEELGYITMGALDKTDEVRRIRNAIIGVRRDLASERESFAKIADGITDFSKLLGKLKKVADKLGEKLEER